MAGTSAAPSTSATVATTVPLSTPPLPSSAPPATAIPVTALDTLTTAIYDLQQQIGQFANRLTAVEVRSPAATSLHHVPWTFHTGTTSLAISSAPNFHIPGTSIETQLPTPTATTVPWPFGMPGYGGITSTSAAFPVSTACPTTIPPAASTIVHTSQSAQPSFSSRQIDASRP